MKPKSAGATPVADAEFQAFWEAAQAAWPDLKVDAGAFMTALRELRVSRPDPARAADLLLAYACLRGDRLALTHFERTIIAKLPSALSRVDARADVIDEAQQQVRARLLVGHSGKPGRLAEYRGDAPLWSWVKTIAVRLVVDLARARKRDEPTEHEVLAQRLTASAELDLGMVKKTHRPQVLKAFTTALAALESNERMLIRLAYVDGLTVDQIGAVYGRSRATAARWVAAARQALTEKTHRLLSSELGLEGSALRSLVRELDVSLDRSLRAYLDSDPPR